MVEPRAADVRQPQENLAAIFFSAECAGRALFPYKNRGEIGLPCPGMISSLFLQVGSFIIATALVEHNHGDNVCCTAKDSTHESCHSSPATSAGGPGLPVQKWLETGTTRGRDDRLSPAREDSPGCTGEPA
jgi:hypothetical protein